jgi:hypothetical protein
MIIRTITHRQVVGSFFLQNSRFLQRARQDSNLRPAD